MGQVLAKMRTFKDRRFATAGPLNLGTWQQILWPESWIIVASGSASCDDDDAGILMVMMRIMAVKIAVMRMITKVMVLGLTRINSHTVHIGNAFPMAQNLIAQSVMMVINTNIRIRTEGTASV